VRFVLPAARAIDCCERLVRFVLPAARAVDCCERLVRVPLAGRSGQSIALVAGRHP
jgi:hypothetical protein